MADAKDEIAQLQEQLASAKNELQAALLDLEQNVAKQHSLQEWVTWKLMGQIDVHCQKNML